MADNVKKAQHLARYHFKKGEDSRRHTTGPRKYWDKIKQERVTREALERFRYLYLAGTPEDYDELRHGGEITLFEQNALAVAQMIQSKGDANALKAFLDILLGPEKNQIDLEVRAQDPAAALPKINDDELEARRRALLQGEQA